MDPHVDDDMVELVYIHESVDIQNRRRANILTWTIVVDSMDHT
jgi:hypothetical protein